MLALALKQLEPHIHLLDRLAECGAAIGRIITLGAVAGEYGLTLGNESLREGGRRTPFRNLEELGAYESALDR